MGTEEDFLTLFRKLVERYELPPDAAEQLLQKILLILSRKEKNMSNQEI